MNPAWAALRQHFTFQQAKAIADFVAADGSQARGLVWDGIHRDGDTIIDRAGNIWVVRSPASGGEKHGT